MRSAKLSILAFFIINFYASADQHRIVKVISGAEIHAMTEACDCPNDPGGGLAKQSSLINMHGDRNSLLLLDAGGFAGGGIYDSYSEGRAGDSARTLITIKVMGKIGYDAVAIGDEELQFGGNWIVNAAKEAGVRLISANCFTANGKPLTPSYVLVKKAGVVFGITALTSTEKLLTTDPSVSVKDPFSSLSKIWKQMSSKSDYQIILSHLGQKESSMLADSFPGCDLIVNGHRKSDQASLIISGSVPVMQFGFQGKKLSFAEFQLKDSLVKLEKYRWLYVNQQIPDDSTIIPLLKTEPVKSKSSYDLYIMSQCPYGIQALAGFVEFVKEFKDIDWKIQFIGTIEDDTSFSSLHGVQEVEDEMMWLAIKELYPEKWMEFLEIRSREFVPTLSLIKKLKIDSGKIQKWIEKKGMSELKSHYQRSNRLNIKASPTLLVNNIAADISLSKDRLVKYHCEKTSSISSVCSKVPQCIDDNDCKKKGKIGRCGQDGNCIFKDAVPFKFTVLVADSTYQNPEYAVITTTEELFPGANVNVVKLSSPEGRELIGKFKPIALPFYLFSNEVKQAYNYSSIENGLEEKNGYLVFKDNVISKNYLLNRELVDSSIVLFIDPFFPQVPFVIDRITSSSELKKRIKIQPLFFQDPSNTARGTQDWFRMEEANRWLIIEKLKKEKYLRFLNEYSRVPGSSYWADLCSRAGIDPDSVLTGVKSDSTLLVLHWNVLKNLELQEPLMILLNNKELISIRSEKELDQFMQEEKK